MISYLEQLKTKCKTHGLGLREAFVAAEIDVSTYSRTRRNKTSLQLTTAIKISQAIDRLVDDMKPKKKQHGRLRLVQTKH